MVNERGFTETVSAPLKDILADFLAARRAEVMSTSIFEYDREAHLRQVAKENMAEGYREGKISGIIEILTELGPIPEDVSLRVQSESDLEVLSGWNKLAAKSDSMEEFIRGM